MKRVLIFSLTYRPFIGGAEIAQEEILKRLTDIDVTVITARLSKDIPAVERMGNVHLIRVGKGIFFLDKYLFPYFAYRKAKQLHHEKPFDVVQAIMANYAGIAASLFKRRFPNIPYLLTMQSGDSDWFIKIRTWWFYPLYKKVYTRADCVQAISNFLIERARRYGFHGKAVRISNGVDYTLFSTPRPEHERYRLKKELGISEDDTVVITTSRLVYKNAIDQLILGFHEWVTKSTVKGKLIILGDGKLKKRLVRLVRDLDEHECILFLGKKQYSELPMYLQISDIFCRPSRSEGMGNSFVEAMAAGVPVIATRVGGIPDFLTHEVTGLFVEKDNPDSIARAIHEYVTNEQLQKKIILNATALVKKEYGWQDIADQMDMLYKTLRLEDEI